MHYDSNAFVQLTLVDSCGPVLVLKLQIFLFEEVNAPSRENENATC